MKVRLRRVAAASVLWVLVPLLIAPAIAGAQEGGEEDALAPAPLVLRAVDATDPETQQLTLMYGGDDLGSMTLTQRGQELAVGDPVSVPDAGGEIGTVVVVDTGAVMASEGALVAVRERLAGLASALAGHQRMAIVAAGDGAQAMTTMTTSSSRLENAAEQLGPSDSGGAAVYGGIRSAVDLLSGSQDLQPNIVVVTSGANIIDEASRDAALGDVANIGAAVFVAGFGGLDPEPWQELVGESGGYFEAFGSPEDLADALGTYQTWQVNDQYVVPFVSEVAPPEGETELVPTTLSIGEEQVEFSYVTGQYQQGAAALHPPEETSHGLLDLSFLQNDLGQMLGVILVLAAVAMGVYSLAVIFTRDDSALSSVLQPYSEGFQPGEEISDEDDEEGSALARMALVKRAVEATEDFAQRQGYLSRTESALERADMPLRAGEALFFYLAIIAVSAILGLLLLPPMGALVIVLVIALLPPAVVSFKAGQRRRKFEQLLPDMLHLLSGTLRAGYSLMQGVEAVSQEVADPMGKELRRVVTESRLGRPLEQALEGVAERMTSPDFAWAVMAIRIQREVGGNLSELLLTVAETMVQRERLRREVKALTAEGRMSAIILGLLPIGLGLAMFVLNPEYMGRLFETTLGNVLLGGAILSMLIGFAWMKQVINIEV